MDSISQRSPRPVNDRILSWLIIAERYAENDASVTMYSGDWVSLVAALRAAQKALSVPEVWSEEERDGMYTAFAEANKKHGIYECMFAVGSWLLRHRSSTPA